MEYLPTIFLFIILASAFDVLIKEFYVKLYLLSKYGDWTKLPNFWKDKIPDDKWYRIRYAIVLNFVFIVLVGFYSVDIYCILIYIYFLLINTEHVFYQWISGFVVPGKKYFDLTDEPVWMEGLPWNKLLARYHGKDKVTSEEILTILLIGLFVFLAVMG